MIRNNLWISAAVLSGAAAAACASPARPNVVLILADDLGYGDLGCYGATKLKTPNIDRLAQDGMRFTEAHAPSSVCSPTRYSLLTGRYFWRNPFHPPRGTVTPDGPLVFQEPGVLTLPEMFRRHGYRTAAFGKWHLGFGASANSDGRYDWNRPEIKPGPLESGFDYFYGIAANVENHPKLYIENHGFAGRGPDDRIAVLPLDEKTPWKTRVIPWSEDVYFKEDEVADVTLRKAVDYIHSAAADQPIFLYFASTVPHKPITPAKRFVGTSQCGIYGDFVQELDWQVGELVDALRKTGRLDNTLIVFTSDNGAVVAQNERFAKQWNMETMWEAYADGHRSNGEFREGTHSAYQGGNRVPFIIRWPGRIPAGSQSDTLFCLTDVMATCAALLDAGSTVESAKDSVNFLPVWLGESSHPLREDAVSRTHEGIFSIRQGDWKLIEGDPSNPTQRVSENSNQLYNVSADPAETRNVWIDYPETAENLLSRLKKSR